MLRLTPGSKEHDLGFVAAAFLALRPRYDRAYPGTNPPRDDLVGLEAGVAQAPARRGFEKDVLRSPRERAEGVAVVAAPP